MPWRDAQTLHIFAPSNPLYQFNWVEQIVGSIVRPLYEKFNSQIRWMWVTRYTGLYDPDNLPQGYALPANYLLVDSYYRFVAFRLSAEDAVKSEVHSLALGLSREAECYAPEWVNYDVVGDLGIDRFIFPGAPEIVRAERARLILNFMNATIILMINSLTKTEDGRWMLEPNISDQNPNQSFFESIHHLFCNATGVPIDVIIARQGNQIGVTTYWMGNFQLLDIGKENDFQVELRLTY